MNKVHINQLGYRPHDPKKAVILQEALQGSLEFKVIRVSDEAVIYSGMAGEPVTDSASLDTVCTADFSALTEAGEYMVCAGGTRSYPFAISENPYKELRAAVLEMFNYQKCGVDLDCGEWSHPACHNTLATVYGTSEKKDVTGGWHDAGDYGRYIVPAAKAIADLLLAHELSSNKDENLLDIVWFEIEWMLKMQDEKTGGVYHKVSCKQFDALDEMPHDEKDELVLSPISPTATADFAASMALASRFYPDKKDSLLKAALRAWDWCIKNPNAPNFENPPDIHTGGYGDDNDKDERLWAACELFAAVSDTSAGELFHNYIKSEIETNPVYGTLPWFPAGRRLLSGLGWGNMGTYAVLAYLMHAKEKADNAITQKMKSELLSDCEKYMERFAKCPYGISLGEHYPWGSNMLVANNAMMLIAGSLLATDNNAKKAEYIEAAKEHFHYLLGRNPLSQSYISGFGSNPMKNPHHRPSVAVGKAVPGMAAGGPCGRFDRDQIVNERCKDAPPAKRYIDHKESFSTNEITIYWNSPVYFVMAALGF